MRLLPQRSRLFILFGYIGLILVLCKLALGQWVPPLGARGLWFYSGIYAFLVGALLEAPTYVTPAQALAFAGLAALAIGGFGLSAEGLDQLGEVALWINLGVELLIVAVACIAIVWKDRETVDLRGRLGSTAFLSISKIGRPEAVSFPPFLFALLAFHLENATEILYLTLGWSFLVFARPLDRLVLASRRLRDIWGSDGGTSYLGEVIGHGAPGLITIRHRGEANVTPGTPLLVPGEDGLPNVAVALNYVGVADGLWLKGVQLDVSSSLRARIPRAFASGGRCSRIGDGALMRALETDDNETLQRRHQLIGIVAPGTDSQGLNFEVVRDDDELEEGRLLEVRIGARPVLYQLLDGLTKEDILQQKNTRGFVLAKARKVGAWIPEQGGFEPVRWVPSPNTPVFLLDANEAPGQDPAAVGYFPGTTYPVRVRTDDLVTHNAAILGILGIGKTFLALELVERMLLDGVRVICLDLTNQYEQQLAPYLHAWRQEKVVRRLQKIGAQGKQNVQRHVEEGGSIKEFTKAVNQLAEQFLKPEKAYRLLVINPNRFEVWRQDSRPFQDQASMASLTAAEVTRIFSEATLAAVQAQGMTDEPRCCLVYEEAHSLVPEWTAVAYDGDKAASNGTARAILQGRKFGLGCLVVTQRTASVTKTILNQCNTVFAMRVFDATGMDFLSNYIGKDYANVLSGLADRHAVVFGKASSCADPVLIRVNDRSGFVARVRGEEGEEGEGAL